MEDLLGIALARLKGSFAGDRSGDVEDWCACCIGIKFQSMFGWRYNGDCATLLQDDCSRVWELPKQREANNG